MVGSWALEFGSCRADNPIRTGAGGVRTFMKKVTVIDTNLVSLWYYPDAKIVHHQIKGFLSGQPFRDFLMAGSEMMRKHGGEKWLSDDRACPVVRPEDIDWGDAVWFPQLAASGWKYWAIVPPAKMVGQAVIKELTTKYAKQGVTSQWFTDPYDAMTWLQRQGTSAAA